MKRYVVVYAVALLIVPAALADQPGDSGAAATCKALQTTAPAMFGAGKTYKNLGACVSRKSQSEQRERAQRGEDLQGRAG